MAHIAAAARVLLRKRPKDLVMRILMGTERAAGEDYSLYCHLFSAGHTFLLYKLSPTPMT
jgi:hypothetical protein